VLRAARKLSDPIDLSIGQPDNDVPDRVKTAACAAICHGYNGYSQPQGLPRLRDRLRHNLGSEFGRDVGDVLITNGVTGGLNLALQATTDPGDEVIILDPSFCLYSAQLALLNVKAVMVDTYPDFRFPADRVAAAVTARTRALVLNSPNNPTGAVLTEQEVQAAADIACRHGFLIISDEVYEPFLYDISQAGGAGSLPSPMRYHDGVIVLRGFSKSHAMTGWRVGYAAGPQPVIARMTALQQYLYGCAPTPFQHAAHTALDVPTTDFAAKYRRNRQLLVDRLGGQFDFHAPAGGFYLFPKAPGTLTATDFVKRAMEHNLVLFPGSAFSRRDTHFRISYCVGDQALHQACTILMGMLSEPAERPGPSGFYPEVVKEVRPPRAVL
jgi:aspartate aminotransferase/aminotransferase